MTRPVKPTISDVLARPAMNGGWEKLAKQQDEQMRAFGILRRRTKRLEVRLDRWERWGKWALGMLSVVVVAVVQSAVREIVTHVLH